MVNRRHILTAAAAVPLMPAAALADHHGEAKSGEMKGHGAKLADALRYKIGENTVTVLSDGAIALSADVLSGIDQEGYDAAMRANFRDPANYMAAVNGFLIETGDKKILIDAGAGSAMGDTLGRLTENLEAAGTTPDQIDTLLVTHLHGDHVGGAIKDGKAVFQNAELMLSATERDFWSNDDNRFEGGDGFFDLAQTVLNAYGDRVSVFEGETEIVPGITSMPLPGHTPGHTGFMLGAGETGLLIWADIVHVDPVQFAHPEVTIGFDVNPEQAAETRAAILDRAANERLFIAGSHLDFPGFGNVVKEGEAYRWVKAPYPYNL